MKATRVMKATRMKTKLNTVLESAIASAFLLMIPAVASTQTIPVVSGEIEIVWTSDRTSWLEGPSFDGVNGIWFGDPGDIQTGFAEPSRLLRYNTDSGETSVAIDVDADPNIFGTAFDHSGRLLATHLDQQKLTRRDPSQLDQEEVLASMFGQIPLLPNDLVLDSAGGIYFTDWKQNTPELGDSGVYYIAPDEELSLAAVVPQAESANGIAISPDESVLYVGRPFGGAVFRHNIISPGVLDEGEPFAAAPTGVDGITTDRHGNVYVPHLGGDPETGLIPPGLPDASVTVFSPSGDLLLEFSPPGGAVNLTFDDQDVLYMAGWNNLTRAQMSFVPEPASSTYIALCALFGLTMARRTKHLVGRR